jgi:hypothetical protein
MYTVPLGGILRKHEMEFAIYADDTQWYTVMKPPIVWDDVSTKVKLCYDDVQQWMSNNHLKLNDEKTDFIIFSNCLKADSTVHTVQCGDALLHPAEAVRNLGVLLDPSTRMQRHVNQAARAARFHLRKISKIRNVLTTDACRSLVHSTVTSRLDYGNSLLYGSSQHVIQVLQRVQNAAARVIARVGNREHITPVLVDLHWLPVAYRIQFKILILAFKCQHGLAPAHLRDCLHAQSERTRRSTHCNKLQVPRVRCTTFGGRTFGFAAPTLWNNLPPTLRSAPSLNVFKRDLKTHLFRTAYNIHDA